LRRAAAAAFAAAFAAALAAAAPAEAAPLRETAAAGPARSTKTLPTTKTLPATKAAPATTAAPLRVSPPAAVPLPPPPPADTVLRPRGGWLTVSAGAWAGFDLGQSLALHVDYGIERTPASWRRLGLEYHLSVMGSRPTDETELTRVVTQPYPYPPLSIPAGLEKTESWVVEVVPTARVRLAFEKFALFADGGVGLAQTVQKVERDEMFEGHTTATENVTGLVLRLGAGMSFDLSPRTRLLLVPVAISVQLGPSYSAYTPSLGLSYRL
jgi:hypothetical protein